MMLALLYLIAAAAHAPQARVSLSASGQLRLVAPADGASFLTEDTALNADSGSLLTADNGNNVRSHETSAMAAERSRLTAETDSFLTTERKRLANASDTLLVAERSSVLTTNEMADIQSREVARSAEDECVSGRARHRSACNGGDGLPAMRIAVWSDMWGIGGTPVQGGIFTKQCPLAHDASVKCEFRDMSNVVDEGGQAALGWADVVLMNLPTLGALPLLKHPNQVWVSFCSEPVVFDDKPGIAEDCSRLYRDPGLAQVDLVSNYSEAADIPAMFPVPQESELRRIFPPAKDFGTAIASLLLSNCLSDSRNAIVESLNASLVAKGYTVASYGACFHTQEEPVCEDVDRVQCARRKHPFNFAFESTRSNLSSWYITEKVWDALRSGTVPVYWGDAENAKLLLPAGSTIFAADFESVDALADHLVQLTKDPSAYAEYMAWKERPLPALLGRMRTYSWEHVGCNICRAARDHVANQGPTPPPVLTSADRYIGWVSLLAIAVIGVYADEVATVMGYDGGNVRALLCKASRTAGSVGWALVWLASSFALHMLMKEAGDSAYEILPPVHMVFTLALVVLFWPFLDFSNSWGTDLALWSPVVLFAFLAFALDRYLTVPGMPSISREPRAAIVAAAGAGPILAAVLEERVFGETRVRPLIVGATIVSGVGGLLCAGVGHTEIIPSPHGAVVLAVLTFTAAATQCYQRHVFTVSMPGFDKLNAVGANSLGCTVLLGAALPGVWRHPEDSDALPWLADHPGIVVSTGLACFLQAVAFVQLQARARASTVLVLVSSAMSLKTTVDAGELTSLAGAGLSVLGACTALMCLVVAARNEKSPDIGIRATHE